MKPIGIYGASGFGREVAWLIEECAKTGVPYKTACFIDDNPTKCGKILNGIPIMALEQAVKTYPGLAVVSGIGNPRLREQLMSRAAEMGSSFETIVHPRVERSRWIEMGEGTVICAGCILTTNIQLGKQVQINLDCTIGHDVVMGDYSTLAPGVHISGWVHFGQRVYVGTGAVIINGTEESPLHLGDDVIIGAGACVTKSIISVTWGGYPPSHCESEPVERTNAGEKAACNSRFSHWAYPAIEDGKLTQYNWLVQHKDNLQLGYMTDIGAFTYINARYGVTIEDHVQIGSHCSIYSVSTIDDKKGPVTLRKNSRIGSHCTIMPGVTIGENAVVGAHSFVNGDVPDGATVVGVPAKAK